MAPGWSLLLSWLYNQTPLLMQHMYTHLFQYGHLIITDSLLCRKRKKAGYIFS